MANIKVAVRVRPISTRELNVTGSEIVVHTGVNEISLTNLKVSSSKAGDSRERTRRYGFDYCFDSSDPTAENYANQTKIYETLGQTVLDSLFSGYNTCLVAYGQSASGKTYTMMGSKDDPGLTPRLCEGLFSRVEKEAKNDKLYHVSVSYLEIYNERVRDLLKPSTSTSGLRVREHPRLGPYVQGLTHQVVNTLGSLMSYVEEGTKARKTAPTLQNPSSSRSHALLTVALTTNSANGVVNGGESSSSSSRRTEPAPRGQSKLHLVDLAGSENAATCSGVHRLKEGANINKSLVALGNVISALAERGSNGASPTGRKFIPYRDSSLTWLLKDALGGNATTIMLATISPASGSYNETAHTLRFAQRAQSVVNRPVVNENPVARIIRELRAEVARLKSLLLEKNVFDESRTICCCKHDREAEELETADLSKVKEEETEKLFIKGCKNEDVTRKVDSGRPVRRFSSGEILAAGKARESDVIRKFGSYEFLAAQRAFASHGYNRAEVTELKDEDGEVIEEIIEPAFVDIPTLVAVLIKPDDNLPVGATQIEEICSDEVAEDSIEGDFLDTISDRDIPRTSTFGSLYKDQRANLGDNLFASREVEAKKSDEDATKTVSRIAEEISTVGEKRKFRKQDSIDGTSSDKLLNLQTLKRFGSVEGLQKKPVASLERANTTLDKRLLVVDKAKKLNNIKENEDHKASGSSKFSKPASNTSSKESLQRKGSNDSDKSSKDSCGLTGIRGKVFPRKTSLEGLKRETSKDSSSSSSKDEQILISNLTRDKLLRRKSSLDQDASGLRTHTPIQRSNRRAEIVAAVTQRLYNNRKHAEDLSTAPSSAGDFRSSPDLGADVKSTSSTNFAARMKLQEISRKMLGKRRRVCVDTQTDDQTVRVKDAMTLTEEPKIVTQEVGVLTELHENCMEAVERDNVSVLRVKEMATSTDRPKINIVRCKDVECFVNDLDDEDCELHSPRNDSGILSDDTQNYAESNLSSAETSDLCPETDRRTVFAENSTNTYRMSLVKNSEAQTPSRERKKIEQQEIVSACNKPCCKSLDIPQSVCQHCCHGSSASNSERNVISISLPEMINITIESSNVLESKIALMDTADSSEEKVRPPTKESGAQTDNKDNSIQESRFCFKDFSMKPAMSQTDGRIFRIENIFQDPNNTSMTRSKVEAFVDQGEDFSSKKSVTFTSSLGTSSALNTLETATDMSKEKSYSDHQYSIAQNLTSVKPFLPDGLITEVFVSKKRKPTSCPKKRRMFVPDDSRRNLEIPHSVNTVNAVNPRRDENNFSALWEKINEEKITPSWTNAQERFVTCATPALNSPSDKALKQFCETLQSNSHCLPLDISSSDRCRTEMKFPPVVTVLANTLDMDHSFSDDSLDYSEDCPFTNNKDAEMIDVEDRECKHFCPPDVVAHTKKDSLQATEQTGVETNDTALIADFEDCHIEIPKTKPGIPTDSDSASIHDYKSLIFGEHCSAMREDSFDVPTCNLSNVAKKKVSFSKDSVTDEKDDVSDQRGSIEVTRNSSLPKSIIKKHNKSISNMLDVVQSSNDEADDSSQDRTSLSSSSPTSGKPLKRQYSRHEDDIFVLKSYRDSDDSAKSSRESDCKKVRFLSDDLSEESVSDSNSYDVDLTDEGEESCPRKTKSSIVEEYFNEAVKFMRNMNSINEFMNVAKVCQEHVACGRRRRYHRRRCAARDQDYVDYRGQRISLKDNMDEYLKDDDDIFVPTETYDKCLKGIARLETRIAEVSRHNEHLRDKCGIDVTSAGAKSVLANSSTDPKMRSSAGVQEPTVQGNTVFRTEEGKEVNTWRGSGLALRQRLNVATATKTTRYNGAAGSNDSDNKNNNVNSGLAEDLECQIFRELMNVADASHYTNSRVKSFCARSSRTSNPVLGDDTSRAKFPGKYTSTQDRSRARYSRAIHHSAEDLTDELCVKGPFRAKCCAKVPGDRVTSWKMADGKLAADPRQFLDVDTSGWATRADVCVATGTGKTRGSISSTRSKYAGSSRRNLSWRIDTSGIDRSSSTDTITTSTESFDGISHPGDKLRYPGSPRARFLELLSERRRIVQSSRASDAS